MSCGTGTERVSSGMIRHAPSRPTLCVKCNRETLNVMVVVQRLDARYTSYGLLQCNFLTEAVNRTDNIEHEISTLIKLYPFS